MNGTVYPVFKNKFKIDIAQGGSTANPVEIAQMESFSIAVEGKTEEWSPMEMEGWTSRLVTGKSLTISLTGKRCVGDPGNDYIERCAWKTGEECTTHFSWEFPSGAKLEFDCVIDVKNLGGGDSTGIAALEFDALSTGKPVFTPAPDKA